MADITSTKPVGPIVKVELFRDEGRNILIEQTTPVQSLAEMAVGVAKPTFLANLTVNLQTPRGAVPLPVRVPIDAVDILEAFNVFEAQAEAKMPEIMRKKRQDIEDHMKRQMLANPGIIQAP